MYHFKRALHPSMTQLGRLRETCFPFLPLTSFELFNSSGIQFRKHSSSASLGNLNFSNKNHSIDQHFSLRNVRYTLSNESSTLYLIRVITRSVYVCCVRRSYFYKAQEPCPHKTPHSRSANFQSLLNIELIKELVASSNAIKSVQNSYNYVAKTSSKVIKAWLDGIIELSFPTSIEM